MKPIVLDASIVVKWFLPEIHSDAARRLLELPYEYCAPDLLFAEAASALGRRVRRGEIAASTGQALVEDLSRIRIAGIPNRSLVAEAQRLAARLDHSIYDCLYLALAVRMNTVLVTADDRFAAKLTPSAALAGHVRHLQAWPALY